MNLLRFYHIWLDGHFRRYVGKLIVVTKEKVYVTDYQETAEGELSAIKDVSDTFREKHAAVMPSKGYFTSEFLIHQGIATNKYPNANNTVSGIIGNANA